MKMKILNTVLLLIAGGYLIYNIYTFGFTFVNTAALLLLVISVIANISRQQRGKKQKAKQAAKEAAKKTLHKKP